MMPFDVPFPCNIFILLSVTALLRRLCRHGSMQAVVSACGIAVRAFLPDTDDRL
jgi:hypothetical protein